MLKPSFELTDEVESGTIIGVIDPKLYVTMYPYATFDGWNKNYKDWHSKPVYYIRLHKPQKACSLEELQGFHPDKDYFTVFQMYEAMPLNPIVVMPQDAINAGV